MFRLPDSFPAMPDFPPGEVWLAGAGPGDAGLITVLGAHAIQSADVILFDALINETLLKLARPGTELIYAGKRAGLILTGGNIDMPLMVQVLRGETPAA